MQRPCITQRVARIAGALILTAGLALSIGCGRLLSLEDSCSAPDAQVSVNGSARRYTFTLDCGARLANARADVQAAYDTSTKQASERFTHPDGKVRATWICPADPWTSTSRVRCTRDAVSITSDQYFTNLQKTIDNAPQDLPYSAQALTGGAQATLQALLLDALKPKPAPAPPSAPAPAPKPTKPDLALTRLTGPTEVFDGMTAVYEVAIWNEGTAANGTVQLVLNFLGTLQPWQMVETPAGFTCAPERGFTCTGSLGGVDSPVQERGAVFKVQGHATSKGTGTVVASLNHDRALDESDVANNLKTLNVTVK